MLLLTTFFTLVMPPPLPAWEPPSFPKPPAPEIPCFQTRPLQNPRGGCASTFTLEGNIFPRDSFLDEDGEGLRKLFEKQSPSSLVLLNRAQYLRKEVRWLTYVGSAGVAIVIASRIFFPRLRDEIGAPTPGAVLLYGGASLSAFSFLAAALRLSRSEILLENAIQEHNNQNPNTPIHLNH